MAIHLMHFADQPIDPSIDDMYSYLDEFQVFKGTELSGNASSWGIGITGPKLTRKGAIRGFYWKCLFQEITSRKVYVTFAPTLSKEETGRLLKRLNQFLGGTAEKAASADRKARNVLYMLVGIDEAKLVEFFPGSGIEVPGQAVMMP